MVQRPDAAGRLRPKRVQVTTELREYWSCIAVHDPGALREMATQVLGSRAVVGRPVRRRGPDGADEAEREIAFAPCAAAGTATTRTLRAGRRARAADRAR